MVSKSCSSTAKPCDSCTTASATVFCRADSAFLCRICDVKLHAAKPASRHGRVCLCEVCEQAPAAVTCKADAAALCSTCDRDIHSANPLARRHVRLPIVPFYDDGEEFFEEEAEAASWLLPDPNSKLDEESGTPEYKSADYLGEMDPDLDLDLVPGQQKAGHAEQKQQYSSDGVVPVQDKNEYVSGQFPGPDGDGFPAYKVDYPGSRPFLYNFTSQSISQSDISSSSLEVGVVPNHNVTADETKTEAVPTRASGIDREARVLRYKEKRKNRKFEKTIRYASRKVYAETRPRIKGRFAKRSEFNVDSIIVPTF